MTSSPLSHSSFRFWHGSQRWEGQAAVGPASKGRYEGGPGIYLTTRRERAATYARGSGSLVYMEVDANLRFLEEARLSLEQMTDAVKGLPRLRHSQKIMADLARAAERHPDGQLCASYLVNLCVNHEALSGANGPLLAKWLTEQGVDASLQSQSGNEDWLVVFNPNIITTARKMNASQVDAMRDSWDLGSLRQQREAMATGESANPPGRPRFR